MATFTYTPDYGATKSSKPRVKAIRFGDGYEQRISYGINTNPQEWNLKFAMRDNTETAAIENFLSARNGVESFDWTPPNGTSGRYICREWSKVLERSNLNTINAKFEEVFDL